MIQTTPEFLASVVEFTKTATEQLNLIETQTKAASEKIPDAVSALRAAGIIQSDRTKTAESKLMNHAEALNVIVKLANYIKSKENAEVKEIKSDYTLGKTASVSTKTAEETKDMKESDRVFLQRLGLLGS